MRQRPPSRRMASSTGQPDTLSFMLHLGIKFVPASQISAVFTSSTRLCKFNAVESKAIWESQYGTGAVLRRAARLFIRIDRRAGVAGPAVPPQPHRDAGAE